MFKSLQKVLANRLQAHIKNNHLSNPLGLQSAYVKHHSTESVLLKVHNDIISMQTQSNSTGWKTLRYTRRQIKNDQPGSRDFRRFLRQL